MGYIVRREVRDALPAGLLTSAERLVLLEIADLAGDRTRVARFGPDDVAVHVDMTAEAVRKHVQRISRKGIEIRIPLGTDKNGNPIYAHEGKQTNYRIPPMAPREGGQTVQALGVERVDNPSAEGGQTVQPTGWTDCPERMDRPSTPSPQFSSKNTQSLSQPAMPADMLAALGVEERERDGLIQRIEQQNTVHSPGWWIKAWGNGTLADCLKRARADSPPPKPSWCGTCDQRTRMREREGGYGQGITAYHCPDCHPSVVAEQQRGQDIADSWEYAARNGGRTRADPSRSNRRGGFKPYLNPTDPDTAYAGYRHRPYRDDPAADYNAPL